MSRKIDLTSRSDLHLGSPARDGRAEIVIRDNAGRGVSYGRLVDSRLVDGYLVRFTDDAVHGMWWVIAVRGDPPHSVVVGFGRGRREDARHVFDRVDGVELASGSSLNG
ncbi:MAG TPA: hypothetical protein VNZ44_12080 [Pyrinomonadaceae bacterium]|nr:hypothetical protein [Pyrinomonadaceae bacterium]